MIRTYSELAKLRTFTERFRYLRLKGEVGDTTFGSERYLNQILYHSAEWKSIRDIIIIRDFGCDLGIVGFEIHDKILIHHMNPITPIDVRNRNPRIFEPDELICTSYNTHQAIHFGDESLLPKMPIVRKPGDTSLW